MSDDLAKLKQCMLLLSSEHDGEVVSAARAAGRVLSRAGLDWHWLVGRLNGGEPADHWEAKIREAYELGRRSVQGKGVPEDVGDDLFADCQDAAQWLLDTHANRLREKDVDFLETMLTWRGYPTEKQAAWLNSLCQRYGYKP